MNKRFCRRDGSFQRFDLYVYTHTRAYVHTYTHIFTYSCIYIYISYGGSRNYRRSSRCGFLRKWILKPKICKCDRSFEFPRAISFRWQLYWNVFERRLIANDLRESLSRGYAARPARETNRYRLNADARFLEIASNKSALCSSRLTVFSVTRSRLRSCSSAVV